MLKKPDSKKDISRKIYQNIIRHKDWQEAILAQDHVICQSCNSGKDLDLPHHILFKSKYLEYKFKLWNGILLCRKCHDKIHKGLGLHSKITGRQWMIQILERLPDGHRCKEALEILRLKEKV